MTGAFGRVVKQLRAERKLVRRSGVILAILYTLSVVSLCSYKAFCSGTTARLHARDRAGELPGFLELNALAFEHASWGELIYGPALTMVSSVVLVLAAFWISELVRGQARCRRGS